MCNNFLWWNRTLFLRIRGLLAMVFRKFTFSQNLKVQDALPLQLRIADTIFVSGSKFYSCNFCAMDLIFSCKYRQKIKSFHWVNLSVGTGYLYRCILLINPGFYWDFDWGSNVFGSRRDVPSPPLFFSVAFLDLLSTSMEIYNLSLSYDYSRN